MKTVEEIDVFIKVQKGKTVCICCTSNKKCNSLVCEKYVVTRDKYKGWISTFNRDKYGR